MRARRHPVGGARPVGSSNRPQYDAQPDAAPDHPAPGLHRHDPALGQSLHRALEVDRARLAHHFVRSRLQGAADEPDDDEDHPDLHFGAPHLSRHVARHHHRHALSRRPPVEGPRAREDDVMWDWSFTLEILPTLAQAAIISIEATLLGFVLAASLGLMLALARIAFPWTAWPISVLVELIRATPLLIQIFFLYFVFPSFGLTLDAFTAGVLALGIHYAAYCSEVYRAGFDNIHRGQWEASTALNLSTWTTFKDIIIPQAIPPIVPALGNYLVALFKETP